MIKTIETIRSLTNQIDIKYKEIHFEKDEQKKRALRKELEILELRREISTIRKKIKELEG